MNPIWEPFGPSCFAADAWFARFPEEVSGDKAYWAVAKSQSKA